MKIILPVLAIIFVLSGCGRSVEKPDNLIEKDKMVDIFYDLAVLEAIRSQKPIILENNAINPDKYIFKKYKIDSMQFAKSNQYYASDVKEYKKMYEEVAKRLNPNKDKQPAMDPNAPQVQ